MKYLQFTGLYTYTHLNLGRKYVLQFTVEMHLYYSECENIYLKQYFITVSLNSEFENRKYKLNTEKNLFASTLLFLYFKNRT